ncbi:MAG: hypothetical protein F6J93_20645 [Oscillatoria sp. SIO1A7]|nr:hypothetical protein [Oscillatoria sp. SIO1A7]
MLACVLVLFLVGVSIVTMADVANATEMSAYEHDMKLAPLGTAKEEFVAVRPGGDMEELCESFCLDKETCAAIYYREGESRCYFYNSYGFSLKPATGYNTTFKIWTK